MPSITDFVGQLKNREGLAMANRYRIEMSIPDSIPYNSDMRVLNLLCDATSLPGRQIATLDYQAQKQSIKVPYGFLNEDVTFTFLLTNDYYIKKVFDAWAEAIIDFKTYRAKYLDKHVADVRVFQTSKGEKDDNTVYGVVLRNAFPVTIGGINLDNTAENSIQKLLVVMTYENFEVIA